MNSATPSMVVAPLSALVARCDAHQLRVRIVRTGLGRATPVEGRLAWRRPPAVLVHAATARAGGPALVPGVAVLPGGAAGAGEHDGAAGQVRGDAPRIDRDAGAALTLVLVVAGED